MAFSAIMANKGVSSSKSIYSKNCKSGSQAGLQKTAYIYASRIYTRTVSREYNTVRVFWGGHRPSPDARAAAENEVKK